MRQYRFQTYFVNATGGIVHSGPVNAPRMDHKIAQRIQRKWMAWRERYIRSNPGDYPLRTNESRVVAVLWSEVGQSQLREITL